MTAQPLVELWRGGILESVHHGHAVVVDASGGIVSAWGDPDRVILPRSSCKMIQALPLVASGAADAFSLGPEHLALACASHNGAAIHTGRVSDWLGVLGKTEADFICGPQRPEDKEAHEALVRAGEKPGRRHNNCSGKHSGFLTYNAHIGSKDGAYGATDHPLQKEILAVFEELTDQTSPGFAVDGCSAPNFATSLYGLARAMAWFSGAAGRSDTLSTAAARLFDAMVAHPDLVAGEGRACTGLMRAMGGQVAVKTGAEGVFIAILPAQGLGVAVKIEDGARRASETAIAAILRNLGALDHGAASPWVATPVVNFAGIDCGVIRPSAALLS